MGKRRSAAVGFSAVVSSASAEPEGEYDLDPDSDELDDIPELPPDSPDASGRPWRRMELSLSDRSLLTDGFVELESLPGCEFEVRKVNGEVSIVPLVEKRARPSSLEAPSVPAVAKRKRESPAAVADAPPAPSLEEEAPDAALVAPPSAPGESASVPLGPRVPLDREYTCHLCNVTTSKVCMDLHVKGKRHKNRLSDRQQKGETVDESSLVVSGFASSDASLQTTALPPLPPSPRLRPPSPARHKQKQRALDKGSIRTKEERIKQARREEIERIRGSESADFTTGLAWGDLGLYPSLVDRLLARGFQSPTSIQHLVIGSSLSSHGNILAAAQTGSGKSLAFLVPILDYLFHHPDSRLVALIIVPTRELGKQLHTLFCALDPERTFFCSTLIGGENEQKQARLLRKSPQVLIGTPGRIHHYIKEEPALLPLSSLQFLVLDEADRLVAPNSFVDLPKIVEFITSEESKSGHTDRETMLFSATLTLSNLGRERGTEHINSMQRIIDALSFSSAPKVFDLSHDQPSTVSEDLALPEGLSMYRIKCEGDEEKQLALYSLFLSRPGKYLVFVNTIESIKYIVSLLTTLRLRALPLHAHLQQRQRLKNLERFKRESDVLLVASDVAARGVDVGGVSCVVHYHMPQSSELFVHRMGRTARGAHEGMGICLLARMEAERMKTVEETLLHRHLPKYPLDSTTLKKLRTRVQLAEHICKLELEISAAEGKKGWTKKLAKDLEVDASEEEEEDPEARGEAEFRAKRLRQGMELSSMLEERAVPVGVSHSYFTSNDPQFIENAIQSSSTAPAPVVRRSKKERKEKKEKKREKREQKREEKEEAAAAAVGEGAPKKPTKGRKRAAAA